MDKQKISKSTITGLAFCLLILPPTQTWKKCLAAQRGQRKNPEKRLEFGISPRRNSQLDQLRQPYYQFNPQQPTHQPILVVLRSYRASANYVSIVEHSQLVASLSLSWSELKLVWSLAEARLSLAQLSPSLLSSIVKFIFLRSEPPLAVMLARPTLVPI